MTVRFDWVSPLKAKLLTTLCRQLSLCPRSLTFVAYFGFVSGGAMTKTTKQELSGKDAYTLKVRTPTFAQSLVMHVASW